MNDSELQYEVTLEDAEAFAVFHHQYSPMLQRRARMLRLGLSVVIAAIAGTIGALTGQTVMALVGLGIALAYWFLFPRRYLKGLRQTVRRTYQEGRNTGVLGPTRLVIDEEFVTESTGSREVRTRWSAIEAVEETRDHAFVYITGSSALIIPRRGVDAEKLAAMLAEIRSRLGR